MKNSEIQAGKFYSDGKCGLREVLEIGEHLMEGRRWAAQSGVRYKVHSALQSTDLGMTRHMTLPAFAAWARQEIPTAQVTPHLLMIQAKLLARRLSETQIQFLLTLDNDLTEQTWIECHRPEFRIARMCQAKRLIAEMPDDLPPHERRFDIRLSALGLAVRKHLEQERTA